MAKTDTIIQGPRESDTTLRNVELVLFDVDNTLVGNESPDMPTGRFKIAATEAKKYVKIGLASARGLNKLEPIMKYLDINGPSIMLNGSQVYDFKKQKFLANWDVSTDSAKQILNGLDILGVMHWLNDSGIDFYPDKTGNSTKYRKQVDQWDRQSKLDESSECGFDDPILIVAAELTEEQLKQARQLVEQAADENLTSYVVHETKTSSGEYEYDMLILNKDANKKHAFNVVLEAEGIKSSKAMMVGDGRNDEVVVAAAGVGVAMSNAAEPTINVATHIAPNQWDDGAAAVLEELVRAKKEHNR